MSGASSGFWRDRPVFVTGATGLLGSWMVQELIARGAAVTCLVRDHVPRSRLLSEGLIHDVNVVHGSLEDHALCLRALNEYEIDTVLHLGAQTIVGTASRSALSTFEANVRGTWNLLEAAHLCSKKVSRVVVASSDKAYGIHETLPYQEDAPLQGRYPYDVSKSCTDLISFSYFHTYGLPVCVTRCGNLYGGGDLNWNRLIPGTIRSALQDEAPIIRSDGKFLRDYFYVEDAVGSYLDLAEGMDDAGLHGEAFNFGTQEPKSVIEIVDAILASLGKTSLQPRILNEASHEIPEQYLDCTKAQERMGWKPRFELEAGLERTVAWYREFLGA